MQSRWWFNSDASFEIHHTASALHLFQPHLEPSVCSPSQTQLAKLPFGSHSAPCHQHTLNPYSSVSSPPISRHYSPLTVSPNTHSHTHTLTLTQGPRCQSGLHMANATTLPTTAWEFAMLAWPMVRFLPLDGGMFIVPLSPLDCCPCTHLNSRGSHSRKSQPPFCSSLVPASSKTLIYLSLVFARLVPRPSRFMSNRSATSLKSWSHILEQVHHSPSVQLEY
ncbi:hypothetical protein QR685DRAFT_244550 [Neurospora intermedia]|uniref:Uncharacterized protein n=1 Tax=Neurospora intermedia TaxID=5142 RepID=A0ABR3DED1_NEUIN